MNGDLENPFYSASLHNDKNQASRKTMHTITIHPSRLKRERLIIALSVLLPAVGFVWAIALAIHSGIHRFDLILLVSLSMMTVLGVEVGYHRLFSHHAFETVQPVRIALAITGCMALEGPIVYWASNHRRHHTCSDRADDPHSPYKHNDQSMAPLRGWWHAHMGWIFDAERTFVGRYWSRFNCRSCHPHHRSILFTLGGLRTSRADADRRSRRRPDGFSARFFVGRTITHFPRAQQGTYCINSFCHQWGTRPFDTNESK